MESAHGPELGGDTMAKWDEGTSSPPQLSANGQAIGLPKVHGLLSF